MRVLENRVPPVVAVLFTALLMWLVSVPAASFVFPARHAVAACVALTGTGITVLGVLSFRRAGTTVNPLKPDSSSSLVASGVYTFTRNPMYLGFFLALLAWAVILSSALAFVLLPAFAAFMNRFQIEPEERALTARFGQEFLSYKSRVRRWL